MDGSTPLNRLPIVVIDLETTGLNVATDRIVQIGGVEMLGNKIQKKKIYNQLVNPGIPINSKITKIHNIDDEKIKEKPYYKDFHLSFHQFLKDKIIIGFNIGYDLAILRNETDRLGLTPLHYRYLDVRLLGLLLNIPSEMLYLESLADYFSISGYPRHDALGDSFITGEILSHFLPLLRKKNIRTLGEAERRCSEKMGFLSMSYSSDWYYPNLSKEIQETIHEQEWTQLEKIDPFPFSHTVNEFMSSSLLSVDENVTIHSALKEMSENSIGSILIQKDKKIIGIFTERDLLHYIAEMEVANHQEKFLTPIKDLMKSPVIKIQENTFIYQAIQTMVSHNTRHLLVMNKEGNASGIISQRDFLKTRLEDFYQTQTKIDNIKTPEELAEIHAEIPVLVRRLMKEDLSARKITQIISLECNTITEKSCQLAIEKMGAEGKGEPPCNFSVLALGSSGRGESMLAFDQDNAIIYQEVSPSDENQKWFLAFGKHLNKILNTAGIPYCKGEVMAGNPQWCMSLDAWKKKVDDWFTSSNPESILNADIFVDYIHVCGDYDISHELRKYLANIGKKNTTFLKLMGEEIIASINSPLNFLGKIKTEHGWLDMKKTILFPIVATARLLALRVGYWESNQTDLRYQVAKSKIKLNDYEIEIINEIHAISMSMMLEQQLNNISLGKKANNRVFLKLFKKMKINHFQNLLSNLESLRTMIMDAIVHKN